MRTRRGRRRDIDALSRELAGLRDQVNAVANGTMTIGEIVTADTDAQTASVQIAFGDQTVVLPNVPVVGNYIPEAGHIVPIAMNGSAPIITPPVMPITSAPPAQVTGVVVTPAITALMVSWAGLTDADVKWNRGYYEVQIDDDNTFPSPTTTTVAGTRTVLTDLDPDTEYFVRVRAHDYVGTVGDWSAIGSGTILFVTETVIADDSISTPKLQANSVDAGKLAAITLDVGKYIESTSYTPGVDGWHIDADGNAEFNDGLFRGTLEATTIATEPVNLALNPGCETAPDASELLPNGTFDANATGWAGQNCVVARITSSPTPQAGAGALRLTASSAGDMYAYTPEGTSGIACQPMSSYKISTYARAGTTGRACRVYVLFFTSSGSWIGTLSPNWGAQGGKATVADASGAWSSQLVSYATAPPNAAFMSVRLHVQGAANAEVHYFDTASLKEQARNWGYNGDVDLRGAWDSDQVYVTRNTSSPHTGLADFFAPSIYYITGRYSQAMSFLAGVTPGTGYELQAEVNAGTGYPIGFVAAWYDQDMVRVADDPSQSVSVIPTPSTPNAWRTNKASFIAPAGAYYCVFGLTSMTLSGTDNGFSADNISMSRTNLYVGGVLAPSALFSRTEVYDESGPVALVAGGMPYFGTIDATTCDLTTGELLLSPGWILMFGQTLLVADWPRLFSRFQYQYGGNLSTTFGVPDLRGRLPVGLDNMAAFTDAGRLSAANTLGGTGGDQNLQAHSHGINDPGHAHGSATGAGFILQGGGGVGVNFGGGQSIGNTAGATTGISTQSAGAGGGQNMPPYILVTWAIKA